PSVFDSVPTATSCSEVKDGSGITSRPLYFASVRSLQVLGRSAGLTASPFTAIAKRFSRCAIQYPSGSFTSAGILSKFAGLNATNVPRFVNVAAAAGSEVVRRSASRVPALSSCMKRLSTAEPPERKSSTLMPVSFSKALAMLCAAAIGVEVYHRTLPSRLAAAISTVSAAQTRPVKRKTASKIVIVFIRRLPDRVSLGLMRALIDWRGLGEEGLEDVIDQPIIGLLERSMRDARHDRELLVGVRQALEKGKQVLKARDPVIFAAHDDGRRRDLRRIDHRQSRAHIDIGAGRHGIIERQDRVGESLDCRIVRRAGMIAGEDAAHEGTVDRPAVDALVVRQALAAIRQSRAAFAGPDHRIERQTRDAPGMALGKERGAQRARGNAIDQERSGLARLCDIVARRGKIVGAVGDVAIDRALFVGAAIALHIDAPAIEAEAREIIHHRGIRPSRHLQIEGRLRGHGRAMNEEDRAARGRRIALALLPEKEPHIALLRPMLLRRYLACARHPMPPLFSAAKDLASRRIDRQERLAARCQIELRPRLNAQPQRPERHDIFGEIAEISMLLDEAAQPRLAGALRRFQPNALRPDGKIDLVARAHTRRQIERQFERPRRHDKPGAVLANLRREEIHQPHEIGDDAVRRAAIDLARRAVLL